LRFVGVNGREAIKMTAAEVEAFPERMMHKRLVVAIDPAKVVSWDHRKLAESVPGGVAAESS
jgi:hypothetical protein